MFRVENMLREARRQKELVWGRVPEVCVIDPDGDIVDHVRQSFAAARCPHWACYHTRMWEWTADGVRCGIVGRVVGGSFSVLVAEQLFASGCRLLVNVASAGQIVDVGPPPYYILIERAMRDEGTSYHYLPPSTYAAADPALHRVRQRRARARRPRAPCRRDLDDRRAIPRDRRRPLRCAARDGILAVEMEAAALYAFAAACRRPVICLAHVSNQLGCVEGDFEKGEGNGAATSLALVTALAQAWSARAAGGDADFGETR